MTTKNIFKHCLIAFMCFISVNALGQDYPRVEDVNGLEVGLQAPLFEAKDSKGETFDLAEALSNGSVVLIFYRGQWCSYCNRHISEIQDSLKLIVAKGASVIAVSPEKPDRLEMTRDKTGATLTLLYDEGYRISNAYGVTFLSDMAKRTKYNLIGAELKKAHSDSSERLPVPATYVIKPNGQIVWRHFDRNYKNRSTVKQILEQL